MASALVERYDDRIAGVLSCYDRVVITGTLPGGVLRGRDDAVPQCQGIRIFDYPEFADDAA